MRYTLPPSLLPSSLSMADAPTVAVSSCGPVSRLLQQTRYLSAPPFGMTAAPTTAVLSPRPYLLQGPEAGATTHGSQTWRRGFRYEHFPNWIGLGMLSSTESACRRRRRTWPNSRDSRCRSTSSMAPFCPRRAGKSGLCHSPGKGVRYSPEALPFSAQACR